MPSMLRLAAVLAAAVALAPAAQAQQKLGFVDLQRALNEVDEGKAAKALLKRDFDEKQKQLDSRKAEFDKSKAEFEKQAVVMAEGPRKERATELDRKAMELQQFFVQLQQDLSTRERDATRGIFDKMSAVVREIAEADGFTMIFERNDSGIVYAPNSLDVTNELIRKYNAKYPGGAAAKTASKPSPTPASKPAAPAPAAKK